VSGEALVGLDVGTTAVKGIAIDPSGAVLAAAEAGYQLSTPRPGWVEQDPEDWWRASERVLGELVLAVGQPAGIGLSGQMHGLVALDGRGRVLRPAILWSDQRAAGECRALEDELGLARLIALSGNRALAGFTAPKLLWLRTNEPSSYRQIARICLPKDYVRLRLSGEHATDVADASGTLLLDVAARRWSKQLVDALDLDPAWLPAVLESPQVSGLTGAGGPVQPGVPVAAGAGDQAAGALGVGIVAPGPASVVLGTSGVVLAALGRYATDSRGRVHAFCHAAPETWCAMGVILSAAGALRWLRDALSPEAAFEALLAEAERWPAGVEGALFLPYLAGERTPHADPDARGAFTGLGLRHDRGALVRAVLEGVAFALADCLEVVSALAGRPPLGRVSGGGARSPLWLRVLASVLELPLERPMIEAGAAFGAALLGGVAAGAWPDAQRAAGSVRMRELVEPVDQWVDVYRERRGRFRELYPALRALD
jgi:xylulokinase